MKKLLALICLCCIPAGLMATTLKKTLSEAIADKSIQLDAVNYEGAYLGKTTRLMVTNNTKNVLQLKVDLGVILKPADPDYQPMVLAGEEMLVIMPSTTGEVKVQTFCGNSPLNCPSKDLHYSYWRAGSDTLVRVLRFIKNNNLYNYLGQHAVWVVTNHARLSDVYDQEADAVSKQLTDLLNKLTGQPIPDYYVVHHDAQTPGAPAFVPKALKIVAEFEVRLETPKTMTLGIYDGEGKMIQKVFENQQFEALGHRFGVEFESSNVQAGNYYIRLKEGDVVLQEKMVKVE